MRWTHWCCYTDACDNSNTSTNTDAHHKTSHRLFGESVDFCTLVFAQANARTHAAIATICRTTSSGARDSQRLWRTFAVALVVGALYLSFDSYCPVSIAHSFQGFTTSKPTGPCKDQRQDCKQLAPAGYCEIELIQQVFY